MRKLFVAGAVVSSAALAGYLVARRGYATWGVDPAVAGRRLPGDDLVADPTASDTRAITIDAPPSAVWPWLLQLGYGRGGWYSYDVMDMRGKSADAILPEHQWLAVGDTVPTDPRGGFEVRVLERERALVLFVDQEIASRRLAVAAPAEATPAGLEASGRFMQASMPPEFAVSWAIVLEPLDGGRTRLVERLRARYGAATPGSRALGPVFGFGMFLMTRRQMLGLKARAELLVREGTVPASAMSPAPGQAAPATAEPAEPAPAPAEVAPSAEALTEESQAPAVPGPAVRARSAARAAGQATAPTNGHAPEATDATPPDAAPPDPA